MRIPNWKWAKHRQISNPKNVLNVRWPMTILVIMPKVPYFSNKLINLGKCEVLHVRQNCIKLSSHEQCFFGNEYLLKKLQQSICVHTDQRNLLNKICQWIFTKVIVPYNICSRFHTNDENSPTVTWDTFVRVNYHLCWGFQCHIIFVATDFGQSF